MTITAATIWEVRTGGAATNGGGFDASFGGTDYTLQTAAQATGTGTTATTTLTATTGIFTSAMVGNMVTNGTNWAQIVAFTSSTIVTLDSSPSWTAQSISVGGAMSRPDTILGTSPIVVAGNTVFIQGGTFTSTTTETLGADGSQAAPIWIVGYKSGGTRSNIDCAETDMPLFTSATNSIGIFTLTGATSLYFRNIKVTHTAATRSTGWVNVTTASVDIRWINCVSGTDASNAPTIAWQGGSSAATCFNPAIWVGCTGRFCTSSTLAAWNTTFSSANWVLMNCNAHDNVCGGYAVGGAANTNVQLTMLNCIAETNTLDGLFIGITSGVNASTVYVIDGCDFYNNTLSGIHIKTIAGTNRGIIKNCVFTSNTRYGIECDTASVNENWLQLTNAFFSNTLANRLNIATGQADITLTASPYTDAANRDFSLNNTASAGASCRALGYPTKTGVSSDVTTTSIDVGASQVTASASVAALNRAFTGSANT